MRIVQVAGVIAERYGGPSIGALELNRAFNRLGNDAVIVSTSLDGASVLSEVDVGRLVVDQAVVDVYAPSFPRRLQFSLSMIPSLARHIRRADFVHIHGQYLPIHVVSFMLARALRTEFGIQVHGSLEPYQRRQSRKRKWIYNLIIGRQILRAANYVQFASQSEALGAREIVPAAKATVVPLGAALPVSGQMTLPSGAASRRRTVLFLGRLASKKRPDVLMRAWAAAKKPEGSHLFIVGPDDDLHATQLVDLAQELGVLDSVSFPGPVGRDEKGQWYERAGTFVLPSLNENFGIAVAEAMLAGCHVIATKEVAAAEHLRRAESGHVLRSPEEADLVAALNTALSDDEGLKHSGQRAEAYARQHLTWDATARTILRNMQRSAGQNH